MNTITANPWVQFVLVCLGLWVIFSYITPKWPEPLKTIANVAVGLIAIFWILNLIGLI